MIVPNLLLRYNVGRDLYFQLDIFICTVWPFVNLGIGIGIVIKSRDTSTTRSRDKSKTLYLYFHKAYGPPTLPVGDFGWGDSTHKVTWYIDRVVTWQIKNVISSLSQGLWTPHITGWWLRMRGLHPQIYMTLQFCGHVTNKKRFISIFRRLMDPKLRRVVT